MHGKDSNSMVKALFIILHVLNLKKIYIHMGLFKSSLTNWGQVKLFLI